MKKNYPLVGQMVVGGESNITSCSISRDGSILVVSTVTAIKVFHLTFSGDGRKQLLEKVRKIKIPSVIESAGATAVQISRDCRWLCWIQEGCQVRIARITQEDSGISIQSRPTKLKRLRRDTPSHVRLGGLGNYERRVTHVAFSPDSSLLATADLAGYIDTWVLDDGGVQNDAASAEDDDEDDDDDEDEDDTPVSGPAWVRNPKASLIPKLSQTPVVLSFSDDAIAPLLRRKGEEGPDDYILLAVTAASRIYTFNPLEGCLTTWTRKNTAWKLPEKIRATRDRIKGVLWQGPKIYMYTASFLFMLDTSFDFPEQEPGSEENSRKRKRGTDSGAGSKTEIGTLAPHVRMSLAGDDKTIQWVDVEMDKFEPQADGTRDEDENDDAEEDVGSGELEKLREREQRGQSEGNGDAPGVLSQSRKWWHTYKYRPILGIVPIEFGTSDVAGSSEQAAPERLEVVLVERPKWDIDMPARNVED